MVRLKDTTEESFCIRVIYFNSKMVRLKVDKEWFEQKRQTNFNSKMVRLKVSREKGRLFYCLKFQFQNGTIKSKY